MQDLRCSDKSTCGDEPAAGSVVTSPRHVIHAASPTSYSTDDQSAAAAAAAAAAMTSSSVTSLQRGGGHVTSSHLTHRAQAKSAAEAPSGRRVEELEQLVDEVQASEREAWRWLDEALISGGGRARDLQQYISDVERHKRVTSETIAHLLQLECTLRQQLSRSGQRSASDPDEAVLDEVRRSLSNIVGRLHAQQSGTPGERLQSARAAAVTPTAYSTAAGRGQDGGGRAGAKFPQDGGLGVPPGGVEVDEGYDALLQSDGFSNGLHGNQRERVVVLESEIQRLTRLVDGYRAARSKEEHSVTRSGEMMRAGQLQAAQSDVRRLQSRVSELETDKLQLQRDMHKTR